MLNVKPVTEILKNALISISGRFQLFGTLVLVIDEVVVAIHQALVFFSLDFFVVLSGNRFLPLAWPPITLKVLKVFVCLLLWTLKIEKKNECVLLLEFILGGFDQTLGIQERHEFSKFEVPPNDRNEISLSNTKYNTC